MTEPGLLVVWCEAEDDITLVWRDSSGGVCAEFVQVKTTDLGQLWTRAKVCSIEDPSIVEKSLKRDRFAEPCTFRLVTKVDVSSELDVLKLSLGASTRLTRVTEVAAIAAELTERLGDLQSENGHDIRYWCERLIWDVRPSESFIRQTNLLSLERVLESLNRVLLSDHKAIVYGKVLRFVMDAAGPEEGDEEPVDHRLDRGVIAQVLEQAAEEVWPTGPSANALDVALRNAGLDALVASAKDARLSYLEERRSTRYLPLDEIDRMVGELGAELHALWARYEAGEFDDNPAAFHARCLSVAKQVRDNRSPSVPLNLVHGAVYDRVHRRLLRFDRPPLRRAS